MGGNDYMRLENIEVIFKKKLPINEPDDNGIMYTKEAIQNAYKEAQSRNGLPIEFPNYKGEFIPIGSIHGIELIEDNGEMYVKGYWIIYHGGTEENVEVNNKIVSSFSITGFGVARE